MSFKQRSSPLKQGIMSGFNAINNAISGLNPNGIINNGMTAAQIAYSNTPAGVAAASQPTRLGGFAGIRQRQQETAAADAAALKAKQTPGYYNSPEPAGNANAQFGPDHWVTKGREAAAAAANPVVPVTPTATPTASLATTVKQRGRNWFGATPTNTVDGGPQSVMQGGHGVGFRRRDSHNTTYFDRTNRGSMFDNTIGNTPTPFPQLKKEQMEYNKISPKAFSNAGTIGKMMGKSIPNSPFMQMIDPLTGNQIDPTMNQDPNAPVANNPGTPIPPPLGVQVPTTPVYDINQ